MIIKTRIINRRTPKLADIRRYKLSSSRVAPKRLLHKKPRVVKGALKSDPARLHFLRQAARKRLKNARIAPRGKYSVANSSAAKSSGGSVLKSASRGALSAAVKPAAAAKDKLLSQRADLNKNGDTGAETTKLGLQTADYVDKAAQKIFRAVKNPIDKAQDVRRIYNRINRHVSGRMRSTVRSTTRRSVRTAVKTPTHTARAVRTTTKAARTSAKAAAKAAKATAKTAKTAAKVAAKAVKAAAKAAVKVAQTTAKAVQKLITLIAETSPYSLIVIAVILLLILVYVLITMALGGVDGAVTGTLGWTISDSEYNDPSDICNNYEEYVDDVRDVLESRVKSVLKSTVSSFCEELGDDEPQRIISYYDNANSMLFFPAERKDAFINPLIDELLLSDEDCAEFLATLFVLITREKQIAAGVSENEIFDFDFKRADFEEFIGEVQSIAMTEDGVTVSNGGGNSCRWGTTYFYKTVKTQSPVYCPGRSCERETRPDCHDGYVDDENGDRHYFCVGHPYCPKNHMQMDVTLMTAEQYYGKSVAELYEFTDAEYKRYTSARDMITRLLADRERGLI